LSFYQKLGFEVLDKTEKVIVTDGQAVIEINPDRYARAGVKLYKNKWTKEVTELKQLTTVHTTKEGFLLSDPSGVWIYLVEGELELKHKPAKESFSALGNYSGLSLESTNISQSVAL
ncbi:MAG: hypothetical protein RIA63_11535, partial [Cyclobacteriaceae bacterium]